MSIDFNNPKTVSSTQNDTVAANTDDHLPADLREMFLLAQGDDPAEAALGVKRLQNTRATARATENTSLWLTAESLLIRLDVPLEPSRVGPGSVAELMRDGNLKDLVIRIERGEIRTKADVFFHFGNHMAYFRGKARALKEIRARVLEVLRRVKE